MFKRVVPPLFVLLLAALFLAVPVALGAPSNPQGVTDQACAFGSTWGDGISRYVFGISFVLMVVAVIVGLTGMRGGSDGGGAQMIAGPITAVAGVGIGLGLLAMVGMLSAIALAAAGAPACP